MPGRKVLVTGMSGLIGGAVRRHLAGSYDLAALNRSGVPGIPTHQADITDLDAIRPAFAGQDTVVHLAGVSRNQAGWDEILPHNVIGTYNVFEAAREAGVRRVVIASSNLVVGGWEREEPYRSLAADRREEAPAEWPMLTRATEVRPTGLYACAKVWGEALGRMYSDTHGMSVICIRMGRVMPADRPVIPREYSVWCSQRDVAGLIERCIEAPDSLRFDVFYAVSGSRSGFHDMQHAREVLGFEPQDAADDWRGT